MQLGVYSFGNIAHDSAGRPVSTAQAQRDLVEAIVLADQVGLEYFGIGEHPTPEMPASAAPVIFAAAAARTERIRLGSAVTVLSTDDPVRVYQQYATLDAVSNGRAEITAGRGSSIESYPLFGYDLGDYEQLFAEKIDLLMRINADPDVTWSGSVRPALDGLPVVPRPDAGSLPIWLGTGGSPGSTVRAGRLGLPVVYGIIGGPPERFSPLTDLYRRALASSGHDPATGQIAIANPGFIAGTDRAAADTWWPTWAATMGDLGERRGWSIPPREHYDREVDTGALFVGGPERIAERIIRLHGEIGHVRQFFQMDFRGLAQGDFLRSIELLGTKVKPLVDAALGAEPPVVPTPRAATPSAVAGAPA